MRKATHPDSIAAQLARRDASGIFSDWIHVIIDSYHDRRTSFRFSVNPKGVKKDVYTSNDGAEETLVIRDRDDLGAQSCCARCLGISGAHKMDLGGSPRSRTLRSS